MSMTGFGWWRPIFLVVCMLLAPGVALGVDCRRFRPGYSPPKKENDLAYQDRGERCEGTVAVDKSGKQAMVLISLTSRFEDFHVKKTKNVVVRWAASAIEGETIHIRALAPQKQYLMDTEVPGKQALYLWPADTLRAIIREHEPEELGVLGFTFLPIGTLRTLVHIPLAVTLVDDKAPISNYVLRFQAMGVSQVDASISPVDVDGKPGQAKKLSMGSQKVGGIFEISIASDAVSLGVNRILLAGTDDDGQPVSAVYYLLRKD